MPVFEKRETVSIGIDLGGSHLFVALVESSGTIRKIEERKVNNLAPPEVTLNLIVETVKEILDSTKMICGIGIGLPGNHDSARGICRLSPNFPQWRQVEVTPYLSKALKMPVHLLNDVRVATLGEHYFGAGKGCNTVVMLAVGTGIGGGVVVNGKLRIGSQESAGEIGHMTIEPNGHLCNCGNRGCLEALASGPAIAARGIEALLKGTPTTLRKKVKTLEEVDAKVIAETAQEGDSVCLAILEEAGKALGIAIANLAVTLNPDRFILGGGVAKAGDPLFLPIQKEISRRLYLIPAETISMVPAQLGVRAGVIGAAAFAFLQEGIAIPD